MPGADRDILDFRSERARHGQLFGREDVLAALDASLTGPGAARGWVLVTGQPGMGKSAILTRWLERAEQAGRPPPHHFLRRGVADWDRPEAITRSLAAQIERLYPAQADPEATPALRFLELLGRVSREVLVPGGERLVIVADGLDEAAADRGQNPLPLFLPHALPEGVMVLCGSRPTCPHLGWLERREGVLLRIDLDGPQWAGSNEAVCRAVWAQGAAGPRAEGVEEALAAGAGNALHAMMLREWLGVQPEGKRRVKVWDMETGEPLATLAGHTGSVAGCAVTPDGRHVVSASYDHTLKVHDLVTGRCLATVHGVAPFRSIAAAPTFFCAGDDDGNLWIVEADAEETADAEEADDAEEAGAPGSWTHSSPTLLSPRFPEPVASTRIARSSTVSDSIAP